MINENSVWDWNSDDATNQLLMSYDCDEKSSKHEEISVNEVPIIVEVKANNIEGMASTSQDLKEPEFSQQG